MNTQRGELQWEVKTNQRRERRELQLRVGENEMRKKILGGGAVGASIYHGLHLTYKKRAKLAKTLAGYSILGMWKQGYLGAGRGRWVGPSIDHGSHLTQKKRAKLAKTLAGCSILGILKQGYLGAARGRWVGPSIDQGWHLTRPLAPSGPSVIPCNGPTPDNDTRIGEANLFGPTHLTFQNSHVCLSPKLPPHLVHHFMAPLILERHILLNGNVF